MTAQEKGLFLIGNIGTYLKKDIFKKGLREILENCWDEAQQSTLSNIGLGKIYFDQIDLEKQKYLNETTGI